MMGIGGFKAKLVSCPRRASIAPSSGEIAQALFVGWRELAGLAADDDTKITTLVEVGRPVADIKAVSN